MPRLRPLAFLVVATSLGAYAAPPASRAITESVVSTELLSKQSSTIDSDLDSRSARDWGLKPEEFARYRQLMRGPLGTYSPTIDPLTALGIEARSDEERRRYAELQVNAEGRRVEKLLAYQRAYDEAWKRLRPTLLPIPLRNLATDAHAGGTAPGDLTDRLAIFVKDNCQSCDSRVKQLQATGRPFDLYMVGSRQDDAKIRAWAARVGIDPAKVRARSITLNHDGGRWLSIGGQGELPAVVKQVNGKWQRQ